MKLVHYASKPLKKLTARLLSFPRSMIKPDGLWVSDDDSDWGWKDWCITENFGLDRLTHVHDVELVGDANVLIIRTEREFDAFDRQFQIKEQRDYSIMFNWPEVMRHYDGVIITPYLWEKRLKTGTLWYYGWDVAGGCIWDPRAVESVTLREIVEVYRKEEDDG